MKVQEKEPLSPEIESGKKRNIVYIIIKTCIRHDDACRSTVFIHMIGLRGIIPSLVGRGRTDVSDRHGVCPYMRPIGRVGIDWVDGGDGGVYACRDSPRVCPIPMPIPMPIRSADRITIFLHLTLWFTLLNSFYIVAAGAYAMMSLSCMSFFILLPTYEIQYKM